MKLRNLIFLGLMALPFICHAQDDLPANYTDGWYMATNYVEVDNLDGAIPSVSNPTVPDGTTAIAEAITPDIAALARNLFNDPTRIYNYVHDHIRYVHYFGSHKGAEMALLERSGNDFDQCALLVALLRAAGYSPTYQFGMVSFPYSAPDQMDYQHWIGATMPNTNWNATAALVGGINGDFGYPYTTTVGTDTTNFYFHHIWVQLTVGGTNYTLDPAFKIGQSNAGINIDSAAQINTNNLIADAGGTATSDYVQNLSESSIRSDLKTYTTNLCNYIQNNMPNASVQQILGGQTIIPGAGLNQPVAFTVQNRNGNWPTATWNYIPTNLMAVFIVTLPGTSNSTNAFYVPGLEGSRLSLVCSSSGQAQLYQEDTQLVSVQTTGGSSPTFKPTLTFQHPFGSWNFSTTNGLSRSAWADQTLNQALYQRTNATYILLYGYDANAAWLTARQRQLDLYRQEGFADTSAQVSKETLNIMGLSWLAQTELSGQLLAGQSSILNHYIHRLGRMGEETGKGYYIDVYGQLNAVVPKDTTNASGIFDQNQVFQISAYFGSALEHGIIEQLQNSGLTAASTVKLLQLANTNSLKVYLATTNNWTSGANVSANISGYGYGSGSTSNSIVSFLYGSGTNYVLLPESGSIQIAGSGTWAGSGFVEYQQAATSQSQGMAIGGGYNGGYVSDPTAIPSTPTIAEFNFSQPNYFNPQLATMPFSGLTGADPVNMADGSFDITASDLSLGGVEPRGLNLTRYYSSARRNVSLAGMAPGWLNNYYCTVAPESGWQATLGGTTTPQQMAPMLVAIRAALDLYNSGQPDPKKWTMTALISKWGIDQIINNAVSVNLGNATFQFVKQPDGSYTPPANCTMSLISTNDAYWLQERHGRTFQFNTNNLLASIVDQYGQSMTLTYNASNWVSAVTDWKGRALTFTYTGPNLTSVSDGTRSVSYGYTSGDLTSFTDAEGKTCSYTYDTNHQIIATLDALSRLVVTNSYDISGRITTQLTQGDTNKMWQVFASGYNTIEVDPAGSQRQFSYDDKARQTSFQDALGNVSLIVYDGQDHVTNTVSPLDETNLFIYDGSNNLIETIDPLGFSNTFVYDGNNNLTSSTDGRGNTNRFGYNAQFSLTGSTNGNGDWTVFAFNTDGTLASRQDAGGTTTYAYDSMYRQLIGITYPGSLGGESFGNSPLGDVTNHTNPRGFVTAYAYNKRRQLTNTTGPTNLTVSLVYDANANLQSTTDPRGNSIVNSWSVTRHQTGSVFPSTPQGSPVVTNFYDTRDWLTNSRNALAQATFYTNDAAHRLIAMTDPLQRPMLFTYDNDGHQITATDAASETTTQLWDARGNLVKELDAATNTVGKTYDGAGNLIYLTNRNTNVWKFQYDAANRPTNTTSPTSKSTGRVFNNRGLLQSFTDPLSQVTSFAYDAKGRQIYRTNNAVTNGYQYDSNNNVTVITNVGQGSSLSSGFDAYDRLVSFTNAAGYVIKYGYDLNGNLTTLTYPGNLTVNYYYDALNRLTNVTDWASRQTGYAYDLAGHLTGITRPNNTLGTMGYDNDGELTNIVEQVSSGFPIAFFTLNYNSAGRVQWEFKGPFPHTNALPTNSMTYDADNRLATFNGTSVTVDADGNLTYGPGTNNTFGTYTYDARNELTSAGGLSYGYDPAGNRVLMTNGSAVTTNVIDPKSSQLLMRIRAGVTNYYIYGAGLVYDIDVTATATTTAFYHFDSRGSTVALTDSNGYITDQIEYSPYAMTTWRAGTNDTPFLYNGRYGVQTDVNGLLFMRARYYNPYLCRFINPDPSGFSGGLNFYAFCDGNPISETDPFGLGPGYGNPVSGPNGPIGPSDQWSPGGIYYVPGPLPKPTIGDYVLGGVVVGATVATAVTLAAPAAVTGLTALGLSSTAASATVTVGLGATAVVGGVATGVNTYNNAVAGNWNTVAFNAGTLIGGSLVGISGGGQALAEGISGQATSAQSGLFGDLALRYNPNYPNGSTLGWLGSGPTPQSGGASAALTAAGAGLLVLPSYSGSSSTGK